MDFTNRLNQAMAIRNWKQIDLVRASDLTSGQVNFLVRGKTKDPSITTAAKCAKALGVSLDWMAGLKDSPEIDRCGPGGPVMRIETIRLVEDFESLPDAGRTAILDQVGYQKMKSDRAGTSQAEETMPDNPVSGVA